MKLMMGKSNLLAAPSVFSSLPSSELLEKANFSFKGKHNQHQKITVTSNGNSLLGLLIKEAQSWKY